MKAALIVLCLVLGGCNQLQNPPAQPKYQLVPAGDGNVWRLNTTTGEVKYCVGFSPLEKGPACFPALETPVLNYDPATGKFTPAN
jgi:hypothetical protein